MQPNPVFLIDSPASWKAAMHAQLKSKGLSRYAFVRMCAETGICTLHTAECLMADDGTVTGKRKPSIEIAIAMARLAGFEMTLVPRIQAERSKR